jgi:uncharacterized protein YodC (DUF2158 family)
MVYQFKVGDVVRLNSGGPEMTICLVIEDESGPIYRCVYFSGDELIDSENLVFPASMLSFVRAA